MTKTHALYGVAIATLGALVLSPDALFMRLSGMDGVQMLGWRGTSAALVYLVAWLVSSRDRRGDLAALASGSGITVVLCQISNTALFPSGIALAPVAVMLLAVATVPVTSALLARALHGERTGRATWVAIAAVLAGLALAVTGKGELGLDGRALLGALCGLGVATSLGLNFVTLRHAPRLPILLAMGLGSLVTGSGGVLLAGPARLTDGNIPAILLTGLVIVPVAFFCLAHASRYTAAANVSLIMLLETVLGPLWVWIGTGEAPTARMLIGGAVVIVALALYLEHGRRSARRRRYAVAATAGHRPAPPGSGTRRA